MKPILILYATREGQTRRIAAYLSYALRERGLEVDNVDVARLPNGFTLSPYRAVVLAASVHLGKHEKAMIRFARAARATLARVPTAFVSVSLSEAGAESPDQPPERRAQSARDVQAMIDRFLDETGLHPTHVLPVAGALAYREYNPLVRFVMKRIAKKAGAATDTTRDHELTDWYAVDLFADALYDDLEGPFIEGDQEAPVTVDGGGAIGPTLSG